MPVARIDARVVVDNTGYTRDPKGPRAKTVRGNIFTIVRTQYEEIVLPSC